MTISQIASNKADATNQDLRITNDGFILPRTKSGKRRPFSEALVYHFTQVRDRAGTRQSSRAGSSDCDTSPYNIIVYISQDIIYIHTWQYSFTESFYSGSSPSSARHGWADHFQVLRLLARTAIVSLDK